MSAPFTISLIPTPLSLIHIPRTRLERLSHPIIKHILQANTSFLNITCNELEICLFGDYDTLIHDFEPIARRDRQKIRSRQGSASSANGRTKSLRTAVAPVDPVEISYEKWSVIQVDAHSDSADSSGARIHSISAPLSAAGISIFYQSSYMSDFIFVKEWRLNEVISILTAAGFPMYTSDYQVIATPAGSVPHSPVSPSSTHTFPSSSSLPTSDTSQVTVKEAAASDQNESASAHAHAEVEPASPAERRGKSHSPASVGQVRVLPSDLVCVGLDENIDSWGLKVIKLLAYPDLIPTTRRHKRKRGHSQSIPRPVIEVDTKPPSPPALVRKYTPGDVHSDDVQDVKLDDASASSSESDSSDDEEGYFSHSPRTDQSGSSLYTSGSQASKSQTELTLSAKLYHPTIPSKHMLSMSPILSAAESQLTLSRAPLHISTDVPPANTRSGGTHRQRSSTSPTPTYRVPFFSFTRTTEGCSLTTNVRLLAALFPPHERHIIKRNDALERVVFDGGCDDEDDDDGDSQLGGDSDDESASELEDEDYPRDPDDPDDSLDAMLRCLQIDLSRFGLEKHGLINKFSRVLGENKINHMYSCTLKTANILVDKRNMNYARDLLSVC